MLKETCVRVCVVCYMWGVCEVCVCEVCELCVCEVCEVQGGEDS